jgi:eukaryotic-like serine/threonine-protein kinase
MGLRVIDIRYFSKGNLVLTPGTQFGRYIVKRKLAEGGMAEIYLAQAMGAEGFSKDVVLKLVRSFLASDQQFVDMFIAEARLVSKLNHANVVQIFDFGKHDETYYLAMEFVHGASLYDLRRKCKQLGMPFPPTLAAEICAQVGRGLQYAHSVSEGGRKVGVVHRDVTPHNVLMSFDGAVKLTDFGIAKASSSHTAPGILKGKFAYMSPEQGRGDPVDARTDVFALGIVLWELLTGGRLFDGESEVHVLRAVQESVIAPPERLNPDVTKDLSDIVMKALARNLPERFQSAFELEKALANFVLRNAESVEETSVAAFMQLAFKSEVEAAARQESQMRTFPQPAADDFGAGHTMAVDRAKQRSLEVNPSETMTHTPVKRSPEQATPIRVRRGVLEDEKDVAPKGTASFESIKSSDKNESGSRSSRRLSPIRVQEASVVQSSQTTDNEFEELGLRTKPRWPWVLGGALTLGVLVGLGTMAMKPSAAPAVAVAKVETTSENTEAIAKKALEPQVTPNEPEKPEDAGPSAEDIKKATAAAAAEAELKRLAEIKAATLAPEIPVKKPPAEIEKTDTKVSKAAPPKAPAVAVKMGNVLIRAKPWATVSIDAGAGKEVQASMTVSLRAGKHKLTFVHPKKSASKDVVVVGNETVIVSFDIAE